MGLIIVFFGNSSDWLAKMVVFFNIVIFTRDRVYLIQYPPTRCKTGFYDGIKCSKNIIFFTNFYKNKKEKKADESPKKMPPITSVVQCSPKEIREISIKKLKIKIKDNIKNLYKNFILDLNIKNDKIVTTKTVLKEWPDGYENPG